MDRFKFRVWYWNKAYQQWENRTRMADFITIDGSADAYSNGEGGAESICDNIIIEQCTGLKDNNGNLIYEGDIVIEGGCKGVVKYGTFNCSCCDGVYGWYFDGLNGQTDIRCYEFCEVIGNIHEQKDDK